MSSVRPTDEEFEAMKRKRDAAVSAVIDAICAEHGWKRDQVHVHTTGAGICYCACPDGPCQHVWDGPVEEGENYASVTCSRCGMSSISHDLRCGP